MCTFEISASAVMPANIVVAIAPIIDQGDLGVARLRRPERRHAVRDRLDAGQRGTARRERPQREESQREEARASRSPGCGSHAVVRALGNRRVAE